MLCAVLRFLCVACCAEISVCCVLCRDFYVLCTVLRFVCVVCRPEISVCCVLC